MSRKFKKNRLTASTLRCICGGAGTGQVEAVMLNETVTLVIAVCDRHAPRNKKEAMALVNALLAGIAGAASQGGGASSGRNGGPGR